MKYDPYKIIVRPVLSERSMDLVQKHNIYVFRVHPDATKIEIKAAIEDIFKVKVEKVNTANRKGKPRRVRLQLGRRPSWKKAYIRLAEGSKIDLI
ncbi:MAG: 50S ribosomal protein L23 [Planctomycetota bacterium]|nr:MAG: 50S ribosomal protein L23 [Planctomycetota bacterium]